jgi:TatD DNase family protein
MYIDTHCHINFTDFKDDWQAVLDNALKNDTWAIVVGTKMSNNLRAMNIAKQYPKGVYAAVGVHPVQLIDTEFEEFDGASGQKIKIKSPAEKFDFEQYRDLIMKSINEVPVQRSFMRNNAWGRIVAIGECGLDFYHLPEDITAFKREELIDEQIKVFKDHLRLSNETQLPLIIHCRGSKENQEDAYDVLYDILKQAKLRYSNQLNGVIHCFGGNALQAEKFLHLGFYLGFTGVITYDKTGKYEKMLKDLPLGKLLIETDAPYLTPDPYRGQRNEPIFVKRVAETIAKFKGITVYEVAKASTANALELFNLRY